MIFKIGYVVEVIKNDNEHYVKHFLPIGHVSHVRGYFNKWNEQAYYIEDYGEPLLQSELQKYNK